MVSMSGLHRLSTLAPVMLIGGAAWVLFISLISALVQSLAPDWVRARVLAVFILVYQGGFALGSAAWGGIAQRAGVGIALVVAGIGTISTMVFALFAKLPDSTADLIRGTTGVCRMLSRSMSRILIEGRCWLQSSTQ